jgi:hypothetical protein
MAASLLPLYGSSADDYKIIKKAVKSGKKGETGELSWFKILVTDNKTKKTKVKISLPFSLLDLVGDSIDEDIKISDKGSLNLKKIIKDLKKHGPMTLVEVYEEDETVKIWFE